MFLSPEDQVSYIGIEFSIFYDQQNGGLSNQFSSWQKAKNILCLEEIIKHNIDIRFFKGSVTLELGSSKDFLKAFLRLSSNWS